MAPSDKSLQLYDMMACLGIELSAEALPRFALRLPTARRRCEACAAKAMCVEWLNLTPAAAMAPRFCNSADVLFELRCSQAGPRSS
jgi:hypothetical protein